MYVYVFVNISVGRYGHFSYRHIADTQYYRAQMGLGKIETFCACHRLFYNYSVILNHVCLRGLCILKAQETFADVLS